MRAVLVMLLACAAAWGQEFADAAFTARPVQAAVPWYAVKADLSNVVNAAQLPRLTDAQRKALSVQAFVALPSQDATFAALYAGNAQRGVPTFITADAVLFACLQASNQCVDRLDKPLHALLKAWSLRMLAATLASLKASHTPEIRAALERNAVLFAVPAALLGEKVRVPDDLQPRLTQELARIAAHNEWTASVTDAMVNYTQFTPCAARGKAALCWYRLVPMNIEYSAQGDRPMLQALLITEQLAGDADARAQWSRLYDVTTFIDGRGSDLSYYQLAPLLAQVFGTGGLDRFDDRQKLIKLRELLKSLPSEPGVPRPDAGRSMRQFRVLAQPCPPDLRVLRSLVWDRVGSQDRPRRLPMGLDLCAVLGSPRAAQLLEKVYQQQEYTQYLSQRTLLQKAVAAQPEAAWRQDRIAGWMAGIPSLLAPAPAGWPAFMRGTAWQDKSLAAALGSWVILHRDAGAPGKPGKAFAARTPPLPGYVEPQPVLYERLAWLLQRQRAGLLQRKLLTAKDDTARTLDRLIGATAGLAAIARKELRNEALTPDDLTMLERFAGTLDSGAATAVADLHTAYPDTLHAAVGRPAELWVVVSIQGKLHAARGAVFTQYEFTRPAEQPLDDAGWQKLLSTGKAPAPPEWTGSYLLKAAPMKRNDKPGMKQ